jgi:hypothetical protein
MFSLHCAFQIERARFGAGTGTRQSASEYPPHPATVIALVLNIFLGVVLTVGQVDRWRLGPPRVGRHRGDFSGNSLLQTSASNTCPRLAYA